MPRGPQGQKRPADVIGNAVHIARIATGEQDETSLKQPAKRKSGLAGASARQSNTHARAAFGDRSEGGRREVGVMSYPSRTVARAMLKIGKECSRPLTPLELMKLAYVAHGWKLALHGDSLVSDQAQAWQYGPVFPDLYQGLKEYRANPVDDVPLSSAEAFTKPQVTPEDMRFLRSVFDAYKRFNGIQLSALTHQPEHLGTLRGGGEKTLLYQTSLLGHTSLDSPKNDRPHNDPRITVPNSVDTTTDGKAQSEAAALAFNLPLRSAKTDRKLQKLAQRSKLDSTVGNVLRFVIWAATGLALLSFAVLFFHLLASPRFTWLDPDRTLELREFLFSGIFGAGLLALWRSQSRREEDDDDDL